LREDVFDFSIESEKCHMETLADLGKFVSFNAKEMHAALMRGNVNALRIMTRTQFF